MLPNCYSFVTIRVYNKNATNNKPLKGEGGKENAKSQGVGCTARGRGQTSSPGSPKGQGDAQDPRPKPEMGAFGGGGQAHHRGLPAQARLTTSPQASKAGGF